MEEREKTCLLRKGQQWMPPEMYRLSGGMERMARPAARQIRFLETTCGGVRPKKYLMKKIYPSMAPPQLEPAPAVHP